MCTSRPSAWLITTGGPSPCTVTWICGALKVWCDATRTGAASDCDGASLPAVRSRSVVILKAVLAAGTPQ